MYTHICSLALLVAKFLLHITGSWYREQCNKGIQSLLSRSLIPYKEAVGYSVNFAVLHVQRMLVAQTLELPVATFRRRLM